MPARSPELVVVGVAFLWGTIGVIVREVDLPAAAIVAGRVWVAIDGKVLADKWGANFGPNRSPVNRIMTTLLYSGSSYPIYQWVDDMQLWTTFPTAKAGDPWYDGVYAPH